MKIKDLAGKRFGRLTVVRFDGVRGRHTHWECMCDCGKKSISTSCNLVRGNTTSCGCYKVEIISQKKKTHGLSRHKIYNAWRSMIDRCENSENIGFKRYGGRGIKICKRWHVFENFIKDMGFPTGKMAIDRIDNNKGYSKLNCRWVTYSVNARNTSKTVYLEFEGKKVPLIELSEKYGINYKCLQKRIKRGWTVKDALLTPSGVKRSPIDTDDVLF